MANLFIYLLLGLRLLSRVSGDTPGVITLSEADNGYRGVVVSVSPDLEPGADAEEVLQGIKVGGRRHLCTVSHKKKLIV